LLCPYCISGLYGRVAPVLSLFLVPLVPVAHKAQHGGPAKRGRAAEGRRDRALMQVYAQEQFIMHRILAPAHGRFADSSRRGIPRLSSDVVRFVYVGSRFEPTRRMKACPGFARAALLRFDDEFSWCAADAAVARSERSLTAAADCQSPAAIGFTQRLEADRALEKTRHPPGLRRKMQAPCHPVSCTPSSRRSDR
jgi:hypothetical protein